LFISTKVPKVLYYYNNIDLLTYCNLYHQRCQVFHRKICPTCNFADCL